MSQPTVVVVGLGPADRGLMTVATIEAIAEIDHRYLRTERHPAASEVVGARSFDDVYERTDDFDDVYSAIVEELVAGATEHGRVVYAVPGSPVVAERTVELLTDDPRIETIILPAMSFADLAWARLGVDPVALGARVIDGHRIVEQLQGWDGPVLVAQCHDQMVLSEVKLAVEPLPGATVTVLARLGLPDESVRTIPWDDLDRVIEADHLTSVWIDQLPASAATAVSRFEDFVRVLRQECPWDRAQTHGSLRPYLLEEAHEVLEALDAVDATDESPAAMTDLSEELGDLLFQVVLHSAIAEEVAAFDLADVARGVHQKLFDRHPHVAGQDPVGEFATAADGPETADEVLVAWERSKRLEKGRGSVMDGIPPTLPALSRAQKLQKKAAAIGFDWDSDAGAWAKVAEELAELQADPCAEELGDLLLATAVLARRLGIEAESALRGSAARFEARFRLVERWAAERGLDLTAEPEAASVALWDEAKRQLASDEGR